MTLRRRFRFLHLWLSLLIAEGEELALLDTAWKHELAIAAEEEAERERLRAGS